MNLIITCKNMEKTPAIEAMIEQKAKKLKKQLGENIKVTWTCIIEPLAHISEVEVTGFRGAPLFAKAKADDLYKTFDEVERKISKQAARYHDKKIDPSYERLQFSEEDQYEH